MFRRILLLVLTVSLLLPPAAFAQGLDGATVTLSISEIEYNGTEQTPPVTVTLGGETLSKDINYTVCYENNRNVGTASATVTGIEPYSGSQTVHFKIVRRTIKISDITMVDCIKAYDGTKFATPTLRVTVLPGDDVSILYGKKTFYDDCYVGTNKTIKVVGMELTGSDAEKYTLESKTASFSGGEITPASPASESSTGTATIQTGESLDLKSILSSASSFDPNDDLNDGTMSGTTFTAGQPGEFTFTATNGDTVTVVVVGSSDSTETDTTEALPSTTPSTVQSTNQESQTTEPASVSTASNQESAPVTEITPASETVSTSKLEPLVLTGNSSMAYGTSQILHVTGGGGGTVTYTVEPLNGKGAAEVSSSGVMKATGVGEVLVEATDGQATTLQAFLVTITPATLQISAKSRTATVGDPIPVLTASDYTISGLVGSDKLNQLPTLSYTATPDMTKAGTVGIHVSGALVPEGGNYAQDIHYTDGTLTIQEEKTYTVTLFQGIHGSISADKTTAKQGDTVTVTTVPEDSYVLDQITVTADDGSSVSVSKGRFLMPAGNVTVTALFSEVKPEVSEPVPAFSLPFWDVRETDWFYNDVCYVYRNGLMNGTGASEFSPYATTTRGMLVTILYRMEGSPQAPERQPFVDVPEDAYYTGPVAWCAWNGIVNGTGADTFSPDIPITREQMATIFYRYLGWKGLDVNGSGNLAQFSDASMIQPYAWAAVNWAVGKGILGGKGGGILDPGGQTTRAETAAILQRVKTLFGI